MSVNFTRGIILYFCVMRVYISLVVPVGHKESGKSSRTYITNSPFFSFDNNKTATRKQQSNNNIYHAIYSPKKGTTGFPPAAPLRILRTFGGIVTMGRQCCSGEPINGKSGGEEAPEAAAANPISGVGGGARGAAT